MKALPLIMALHLPLAAQVNSNLIPKNEDQPKAEMMQEQAAIKAMISSDKNAKSVITIPVADRAMDYKQAFDNLRKERRANKVNLVMSNGELVSNVTEMTLTANNTLFLIRQTLATGSHYMVVPVENIGGMQYQP